MKILVVSQYYYPEQFMITKISESLKEQGNDVTVLTGIPNYPMGKIIGDYKNRFMKETINGVKIIRVPMLLRAKGIKMILNYLSYAFFASLQALFLKQKYDCIYVFEVSPVTQIFPAYIYKKLKNKNCQIFVNCQDIWPEVLKSNGFEEDSMIFKIGHRLSKYLYTKSDKILISSSLFKDYLIEEFEIRNDIIKYLPNFADEWVLEIEKKKIDNKVHFLFAGNIGKAQNLELIIQAVRKCNQKENIIVDFVGDGSELDSLKDLVNKLGLSNIVKFHGRKSGQELKEYYEIADAYLLTLQCNNKICYTVPSKVQGYMGAGKPIIASILGGAKELIGQCKCGIICEYNDVKKLSQTFDEFTLNKNEYYVLGENGRKYFKDNFRFDIYLYNLIKYMEE
ncbi:MAG: glycosyltransferase family 4 protein [Erysipelotrichales bacterium]|nr:glycosyltransferase family 4 protein [Erysipelotrichales bacterium]